MRKTAVLAICIFAVGLIVGGGVVEIWHQFGERQEGHLFDKRVKCRDIAKAYERENTDGSFNRVLVDNVDYSPGEDTCLAAVDQFHGSLEDFQVVDLLSGVTNSLGWCDQENDCGGGK